MATEYQVIVGNIGTVKTTNNLNLARLCFEEYKRKSESGYGRAAGEDVTILSDDGIEAEHIGIQASA